MTGFCYNCGCDDTLHIPAEWQQSTFFFNIINVVIEQCLYHIKRNASKIQSKHLKFPYTIVACD